MDARVVLGDVAARYDLLRVEAVGGSQLLDSRAVSTKNNNPVILVLIHKSSEWCVGLDKLLFFNGHGKPETKARGVVQLRESSSVGQEYEGDRIGLECFQSLLGAIQGHFAAQQNTVNVKGECEVVSHALKSGKDTLLVAERDLTDLERRRILLRTHFGTVHRSQYRTRAGQQERICAEGRNWWTDWMLDCKAGTDEQARG